ncbi:8192_t:CDS:2, partial [Diversispora eburnea]
SPPTKKNTTYLISPCLPLPYDDNANEETKLNTCHNGTLICEITTYWNPRTNVSLITSVIPVAINSTNDNNEDNNQNPVVELGPKANADDIHGPLIITFYGDKVNDVQQKANITFICDHDKEDEKPETSYKENTLQIEWRTKYACGIFIVLALYLIIGTIYNYQVYRSQGWDLLPNRDFWRDVPYMASDLTKNLYNTVRGGGNSGYSRV